MSKYKLHIEPIKAVFIKELRKEFRFLLLHDKDSFKVKCKRQLMVFIHLVFLFNSLKLYFKLTVVCVQSLEARILAFHCKLGQSDLLKGHYAFKDISKLNSPFFSVTVEAPLA